MNYASGFEAEAGEKGEGRPSIPKPLSGEARSMANLSLAESRQMNRSPRLKNHGIKLSGINR